MNFPPFRPRWPWWGGDLQTIAGRFHPPGADLGREFPEQRLQIALGDGDVMLGLLNRPRVATSLPLAILIHGLTGSEASFYMIATAGHLLSLGYPVLRLNLRGAGPSRPLCAGQYYAGRSQDFRLLLSLLDPALKAHGVVAVGYSLGGNMLLKYLGEEGAAAPLLAAASVSAPIDLSDTCRQMLQPRNYLYHRLILAAMKAEATAPAAKLSDEERSAIARARNVWEYDDFFIAPRYGFAGAEDYYAKNSAQAFMPRIAVPSLIVSAQDDPWIPIGIYRRYDWAGNARLTPLLADGGGHVGFHAADSPTAWSDRAVAQFFAANTGERK